jgi:acyl-CoA thioesterase FadM
MLNRSFPKLPLKSLNNLNPIGLKLIFSLNSNIARTEFILNEFHQGISGYVHQGILALLMDEGMGWTARHAAGVSSVTAKMEIVYHKPVKIGELLVMIVQITKHTRRYLEESVRIERRNGVLVADGTCMQYVMDLHPGNSNLE